MKIKEVEKLIKKAEEDFEKMSDEEKKNLIKTANKLEKRVADEILTSYVVNKQKDKNDKNIY